MCIYLRVSLAVFFTFEVTLSYGHGTNIFKSQNPIEKALEFHKVNLQIFLFMPLLRFAFLVSIL